jgi:hypothetical protein
MLSQLKNKHVNEIIIVGGGSSIKEGISLGLQDYLKDKFVIACNYAYKHFPHTLLCFTDRDFYKPHEVGIETNPDIYEELKKEPLIVGINHNGVEEFKLPNTILVKSSMEFKRITNPEIEGFYAPNYLCGIFAMSLACYLMNYKGILYLLGFDWTKEGETHYYSKEEINHRGIGWANSYKVHNPDNIFKPFEKIKDVKIFNVFLNSNINNFNKISYKKLLDINCHT